VIAPCAGALWIGLTMAAAGEPSVTPTTTPTEATAPSSNSIVAVRRPPPDDTVLEEAGSRIRSELAAMGLEGQFVDCPPDAANDRGACPDATAPAMISLGREDGVVEISVRTILPDGLELSRHVHVLARDGGDDPAVLAVRAVELLRDLRLTGRRPPPRRPTGPAWDDEDPKIPLPPPPPPVPPRWNLSTGLALLGSPRSNQAGVGPAFGLAIAAGAIIGPRLTIIASFAGPFNSSLQSSDGESATLVQALVMLELRFRFTLGPLEPFGAVLTGVNYLNDALDTAWVPMLGLGGGVSWTFGKRFYLCLEAEAFGTQPDVLVEIKNEIANTTEIVGRTGAPSILLTSSIGLTLP
jgi:hypothetical protein